MNKIYKSKAYMNTKVDYTKSQMKINQLLNLNGIVDMQHTLQKDKATFTFIKELVIESKNTKVGVKITSPNITDKNRNQLYRALYYYLKAKFESLTFGFVEEYNEAFIKEFMPYLVADKTGKTVADVIMQKFDKQLENNQDGEQLFLADTSSNSGEENLEPIEKPKPFKITNNYVEAEFEAKGEDNDK